MRTVSVQRYVTPLREGGSLPAIVEADDLGTYVLKFHGAGQGPKALVAELIAGELGRALGLRVPEIVLVELDPALGRAEPDYEIRALLRASGGLNLALDYLPGSIGFDAAAHTVEPALAARIVWFDGLVTNVDRTARNTNMLWWGGQLHLIDHGAALYFHHGDLHAPGRGRAPFPRLRDHVLLPLAGDLRAADTELAGRVSPAELEGIVALVPDAWLGDDPAGARRAYVTHLRERLTAPRPFVAEAEDARAHL
jgi:hypothetical protein